MNYIPICPETVALAKEILLSGKHFPPFNEMFIPSENIKAKHKLFEEFIQITRCQIPKVFIYIIMNDLFGQPLEKDSNGDLGYKL